MRRVIVFTNFDVFIWESEAELRPNEVPDFYIYWTDYNSYLLDEEYPSVKIHFHK